MVNKLHIHNQPGFDLSSLKQQAGLNDDKPSSDFRKKEILQNYPKENNVQSIPSYEWLS